MRTYEKPEMKLYDIRANESVADACWSLSGVTGGNEGSHNYSGPFYWDNDDNTANGYYKFYVKSVDINCGAPNAYDIQFINGDAIRDVAQDSYEDRAIEKALVTSQQARGNNAQNYKGMILDFPTNPGDLSK